MHSSPCVIVQGGAQDMKEFESSLALAHDFLKYTQVPENPPEYKKYYRQMNKVHYRIKCK